jgi:hypothetical protein
MVVLGQRGWDSSWGKFHGDVVTDEREMREREDSKTTGFLEWVTYEGGRAWKNSGLGRNKC